MPSGEKLLATLINLLAEQNGVKITFTLTNTERSKNEEKETDAKSA